MMLETSDGNYFFISPMQWGQYIPLALASPQHLGHFTLQAAWLIERRTSNRCWCNRPS